MASPPPWGEALWEPAAFQDRERLPSCGQVEAGHGQVPPAPAGCLASAVGTEDGAELAVSFLTVEGDPIVIYSRALPGGGVEVFGDTTRDDLGRKVWVRSACDGFDAGTGRATGCLAKEQWPGG